MEISILTGFRADNLDELQSQASTVKRVESDNTKIVLYLDEVGISLAFSVHLYYDLNCSQTVIIHLPFLAALHNECGSIDTSRRSSTADSNGF